MASSTAEPRNGMRQPHSTKASSPIVVRVTTITSKAASGRKAKPAANKASAASNACVGSSPEKNTFEMTGARLPKMKKSYHSNVVPADDAMMTRAIGQGL